MADVFVFSNRAVTALQDSVDQFSTTFDFGVDDLERFPALSGGAKFPIILSDREDVFEICYVTGVSVGGEATVERAREGTAALSWSAGTFVEHCMTAGSFLAAARLVPKGVWSAVTNYLPGDVVEYTGISYIATLASLNQVPSAASTYWQTLYVPPGISSTALTWSGDWNSGVTYAIGAYVKYQGKLYVAVAAGLNHLPSDASYWYPLGLPPDPVTYDNILTASGTNNYTVTPVPAPTALFDGMELSIVFTNANTAACTLTVGALAPTPLRYRPGTDYASGQIEANTIFEFVYRSGTAEFLAKSVPIMIERVNGLVAADAALDARLDVLEYAWNRLPPGVIMDWPNSVILPPGWLFLYGQAISRTTYAALFSLFGTAYGAGDGSTTFNLPDLRGRVVAGLDNMGGVSANRLTAAVTGGLNGDIIGNSGGHEYHQLIIAELAAHNHGGTVSTTTNGAHSHSESYVNNVSDSSRGSGGPDAVTSVSSSTKQTSSDGNHNHSVTIPTEGSGWGHNNVQPTFILSKIIYTGVP